MAVNAKVRFVLNLVIFLTLLQSQSTFAQSTESAVQSQPVSGACDFDGFIKAANEVQKLRQSRLLSAEKFAQMAKEPNTIVLDARGGEAYYIMHVKGSVNLPFTEFGAPNFAKVVPNRSTRILIYCRNNIANKHPVAQVLPYIEKSPVGGLNIPTAITLYSYGYENVWELDAVVDPDNTPIEFVWSEKPGKKQSPAR